MVKPATKPFTKATLDERQEILDVLKDFLEGKGAVKVSDLTNATSQLFCPELRSALLKGNLSLKGFEDGAIEKTGEGAQVYLKLLPKITFGIFDKPAEEPASEPIKEPAGKPAGKRAEKPAEKPAGKPAGKPAEEPAGKPAGKRAGKPAGKRVGKPAEEPAEEPEEVPAEVPKSVWDIYGTLVRCLITLSGVLSGNIWSNYCLAESSTKDCSNRKCTFVHYKCSYNDLKDTDILFQKTCYFQCVTFQEHGGCKKLIHKCPSCEKVLDRGLCTNPLECKLDHTGTPRPLCCNPDCVARFVNLGHLIGSSDRGLNRREFTLNTPSPADLAAIAVANSRVEALKEKVDALQADLVTAQGQVEFSDRLVSNFLLRNKN